MLKLESDVKTTAHPVTLPPVPSLERSRRLWLVPAIMSAFYLLSAFAFIPRTGLQNDELFFVGPIFYPDTAFYRLAIGSANIPLMVMSYSGALKTWLYARLFQIFEPGVWSVRFPWLWRELRLSGSRGRG